MTSCELWQRGVGVSTHEGSINLEVARDPMKRERPHRLQGRCRDWPNHSVRGPAGSWAWRRRTCMSWPVNICSLDLTINRYCDPLLCHCSSTSTRLLPDLSSQTLFYYAVSSRRVCRWSLLSRSQAINPAFSHRECAVHSGPCATNDLHSDPPPSETRNPSSVAIL